MSGNDVRPTAQDLRALSALQRSSSTSVYREQNNSSSWSSPFSQANTSSSPNSQSPTPALPPQSQNSAGVPSTMIGPTSTFYDPNQAVSHESADYQQWLDASFGQIEFFRPSQREISQLFQPQIASDQPMQNQYNFVSGQYPPNQQYSTSHPQQQAVQSNYSQQSGSLHTALGSYAPQQLPQQPISNDSYYYGQNEPSRSYTTFVANNNPLHESPSQLTFTPIVSSASVSPSAWPEENQVQRQVAGPSNAPAAKAQRPAKRERASTVRSAPKAPARKKQKKSENEESDTDSDDDGFEIINVAPKGPRSGVMPSRLPGACTHCKKLKMKCDFPKNENVCKRCRSGGHPCIVEGRKPRSAPNKREYLLAQIRQKDAIIESLLKQLHNPYLATPLSIASYRMATSPSDQNNRNIIAWLDRLQASVRTAGGTGGAGAFKLDARARAEGGDDDSDGEEERVAVAVEGPDEGDDDSGVDPEKLQNLPDAAVPLGLIANLSLSNSKAKSGSQYGDVASSETLDDDNVGVANETYFLPGPASDLNVRAMMIEQHSPPEILVHGLVQPEDVEKLFDIFYTRVNPFIGLLDPVLHTAASTFARCPFLFTVICAVSSRYYTEKSEIYPIAMHFAKHSAANALIDGWKSVELCQAYILMSIYAVPARRWEEDRSWLYTGLAIRIATDLNLHQASSIKPTNENQEREMLNKTRVWMICFNLDRSTATQFGKPSTIKEDHVVRGSSDWYKKSKYNHEYDVHLCGYSSLMRIVARFHDEVFSDPDSPSGLNRNVDFRAVTLKHDGHLQKFHDEWSKRFAQDSDPDDMGSAFRCILLPFLVSYSRLVMFSFGFQQAFTRGIEAQDHIFFTKCLDAAKSVIKNMIEPLAMSGYMRFAPDGHFVFAAFASAFLLKLLRPEFDSILPRDQETEIFDLIGRLIQILSSPDVAIDDRHTPKLYARFLAGLLSRHRRDGATSGRLHTQPPPQNPVSHTSPSAHSGLNTGPTFSVQSTSGSSTGTQSTPVYRPEATYTFGSGPIEFGDVGFALDSPGGSLDGDMLATMQALKNPHWWQNMMMPGFSWPDNAMASSPAVQSVYTHMPGFPGGLGFHHPVEVPLSML